MQWQTNDKSSRFEAFVAIQSPAVGATCRSLRFRDPTTLEEIRLWITLQQEFKRWETATSDRTDGYEDGDTNDAPSHRDSPAAASPFVIEYKPEPQSPAPVLAVASPGRERSPKRRRRHHRLSKKARSRSATR